jgi:hypothetical protein
VGSGLWVIVGEVRPAGQEGPFLGVSKPQGDETRTRGQWRRGTRPFLSSLSLGFLFVGLSWG